MKKEGFAESKGKAVTREKKHQYRTINDDKSNYQLSLNAYERCNGFISIMQRRKLSNCSTFYERFSLKQTKQNLG